MNQSQNNQSQQIQNQEIKLETLNSKEIELLHYIRTKFRYGEIIIQVRDGLPYRIRKVTEFQTLD